MKKNFILFLLLFINSALFSQEFPKIYENTPITNSDTIVHKFTKWDDAISEIKINKDHTFQFYLRPHESCFTWSEYKGKWGKINDTLTLSFSYELIENKAQIHNTNKNQEPKTDTICTTLKAIETNEKLKLISIQKSPNTLPENPFFNFKFKKEYYLNK